MYHRGTIRAVPRFPPASHLAQVRPFDVPFLSRRLPRSARAACRPARSTPSSPRRPTTSASSTAPTTTPCRASEYLEWTGGWVRRAAGALVARRVALPERRRQAHRSLDGAGRRAGGAPAPPAPEHDPLDQVDRDREGAGGQPRADSTTISRSATTSRSTAGASCTTATSSSSTSPGTATRRSTARPSACGTRTSRTSGGGRPRRPASAAAATRGSSPTRRSRAARRIGRIRPRSRRSCRRCACGCTASTAIRTVADPFLGLGSTAVACAQLGRQLRRHRDGRGLSEGSGRAHAHRRRLA